PSWPPAPINEPATIAESHESNGSNGPSPRLAMRPADAAEIDRMFATAKGLERVRILQNLDGSPLVPAVRPGPRRSARAIETLEMAAYACDTDSFAFELSTVLLMPLKAAERVVDEPGGEPIACAC